MDMLKQLSLAGLVPVIKVKRAEDAVPLCTALKNGGLPVAEITFRTEAAEEAIRLVHAALPDVLLGAGTVLTCEQADRALGRGRGLYRFPRAQSRGGAPLRGKGLSRAARLRQSQRYRGRPFPGPEHREILPRRGPGGPEAD